MYPFTVQLPYVNGYMSILIHGYIINRYTPPASARITPFISNSNNNALIRFTGMLVSITNVLICNPSTFCRVVLLFVPLPRLNQGTIPVVLFSRFWGCFPIPWPSLNLRPM